MFHRARGMAFVLLGGLVMTAAASAQVPEDKPRLILNPGGPAGLIWKVGFSPDSRALYAAGTDKILHLWHPRHEQGRPQATYLRGLRWEIARGFRGVIYSMDLSPKGDLVAVAGVSARQGGDIILFDTATGEIARSLPPTRNDQTSRPGHLDTVISLAFSPNGQQLVSVDKSGEVLLWTAPNWDAQTLRPAIPGLAETQQAALFLDAFTVAITETSPQGQPGTIALHDVRFPARPPQRLNQPHVGRVTTLARDPGSAQWASADRAGAIYLWNGVNAPQATKLKQGERVPASIAFAPGNRLAVGNEQDGNGQTVVELWNLAGRNRTEQIATSSFPHNPPIVFSPDGNWFATYGPDGHEVLLYSLATLAQGQRNLFDGNSLLRLRGRGLTFRTVAFEQGKSHQIGLGGSDGQIRLAFDLPNTTFSPIAPADAKWRSPNDGSGGWTLTSDASRTALNLRNGGNQTVITLDRVKQGIYSSHAFLTDANGRTIAVAVGTDEQNGIFIYSLGAGPRPALLRYFRDHAGNVTSLSASTDGKLLASASEDQTVKIWSLGELLAGPTWATWGAEFAVAANGVQVTRVLPGGIADNRDLRVNDVITAVAGSNRQMINPPAQILQAMQQQPLFEQLSVFFQRAGVVQPPVNIVPGWEPMATLFIDRRNEWAIWTPQGFYDSSAAEGDELFGWQVNRGPGRPPRILTASNLRRQFERPELMRKLFVVGNLPEAFVALKEQPPANLQDLAVGLLKTVPEIQIVSPTLLADFPAATPIRVQAVAQLPAGQTDALYEARGTVDGIPLGEPLRSAFNPATNRWELEWNSVPPDRLSRYHVRLIRKPEGQKTALQFVDASVAVTANVPPTKKYNLHILAFAASNYQGGAFPALQFPVSDTDKSINLLKNLSGPHYQILSEFYVKENDVTPKNVADAIGKTQARLQKADPTDLLVVLIAGHGHATEKEYYFIPPDVKQQTDQVLSKSAVPWSMLREIATIPCRKLILLDTCRSGDIFDQKASIRPLKEADCLVFASTSTGGIALEGANFRNRGAFADSVDRGLLFAEADGTPSVGLGRPVSKDGDVSLMELVEFVKNDVPKTTGLFQFPTYTPGELVETLGDLPLARPGAAGAGGGAANPPTDN